MAENEPFKHMEYVRIWEKYGKKRAYFSEEGIQKALGLEIDSYRTGHIKKAAIDGEPISNSEAARILSQYTEKSIYYDMIAGKWCFSIDRSMLSYTERFKRFFEK